MEPKKKIPFSRELTKRFKIDLIGKINLTNRKDVDYTRCFECGAICITNNYSVIKERPQYCEVCKVAYGYK